MKRHALITMISLILTLPITAGPNTISDPPKIGLALSGGGALGLAHIGVLKVMERAGLQPDYITGTSMGSLIGGLYACGYSATELENIITAINWTAILNDKEDRKWKSMVEKEIDSQFVITLPLEGWDVRIPSGMIQGYNVSLLLSRLTAHTADIPHFDDLPIPFRCVATDLETGEAVVFEDGPLSEAMRASMSIPSIFNPVENRGRILADGMIARNFPVSDVIDMGSTYVIGVDVMSDPMNRESFTDIGQVFNQALTLYSLPVNKKQRGLCDLLVEPDLSDYSTMSYLNAADIIALGEQKAEEYFPLFQELAEQRGESQLANQREKPEKISLKNIRIEGLDKISRENILSTAGLNLPGRFTLDEIESAVRKIYGTGYFSNVTWKTEAEDKGRILVISVEELPKASLNLGFFYDNGDDSGILWGVESTNKFIDGTTSRINGRLSDNPYINLSTIYKTGIRYGALARADLYYNNQKKVSTKIDNISIDLDLSNYGLDSILAFYLGSSTVLGMGVEKDILRLNIENGDSVSYDYTNFFGYLDVDTLDRTFFPESGLWMELEAKVYTPLFHLSVYDSEDPFHRVKGNIRRFINLPGPCSLMLQVQGGKYFYGDAQSAQIFILGGNSSILDQNITFAGYSFGEVVTSGFTLGKIGFQWSINDHIFITPRFSAGYVENPFNEGDFETIYSGEVEMGLLTPLGALTVSPIYGNGDDSFTLYIGFGSKPF